MADSPRNKQDEYLPDTPASHNGTGPDKPVIDYPLNLAANASL